MFNHDMSVKYINDIDELKLYITNSHPIYTYKIITDSRIILPNTPCESIDLLFEHKIPFFVYEELAELVFKIKFNHNGYKLMYFKHQFFSGKLKLEHTIINEFEQYNINNFLVMQSI